MVASYPAFHLWPDNLDVYNLFMRHLCRRWVVGMGGRTGLDHGALRDCLAAHAPRGQRRGAVQRRQALEAGLRAMEEGALEGYAERDAAEGG